MTFHLNCGHQVESNDDVVDVMFKDWDCDYYGFHPVVIYMTYCRTCAEEVRKAEHYLATEEEADQWLAEESEKLRLERIRRQIDEEMAKEEAVFEEVARFLPDLDEEA